jgi:hypothetical protein
LKPLGFLVVFALEERASAWDVLVKKRSKSNLKYLLVRLTSCLALGCLALSFLGIPLPAGVKKDRSVPFPCQDRACGCMSAADCKSGCCCYNEDQRREWAKQRRLNPESVAPSADISACNSSDTKVDCCEKTRCSCCSSTQESDPAATKSLVENKEAETVLLWQAKRCHGQSEWWLAIVLVLPPVPAEYMFPNHIRTYAQTSPLVYPVLRSDEPDEPVAWL